MIIGRRALLVATGCVLVSRQLRGADDQIALYWTVSPPGRQSAVLFGYDRIAAAVAPEIINDGISLVDGCQRVVLDVPQNVKFPAVDLDRNQIKPILQVVAPRPSLPRRPDWRLSATALSPAQRAEDRAVHNRHDAPRCYHVVAVSSERPAAKPCI
jgi:hypothetical protein